MESKLACRTCLADTGELFELFGDTGMELGLPMKINEHLRIPVDQTDEFTMMCGKCIGILNEFHDMFNLAQEIQPHFEQIQVDNSKIAIKQEYVEVVTTDYVVEEEDDDGTVEEVIIEETVEDEDYLISEMDEEAEEGEEDEEEEGEESELVEGEEAAVNSVVRQMKSAERQSRAVASAARIEEENELIRQTINLACVDCGDLATTFEDLMLHYRQVHKRDGLLTCCNRPFNKRRKLVEHAKLHVNPNEFSCEVCKKSFSSKYYLTHHMSIHVPEDLCEYQCDKCSKRFPTRSRLSMHIKVHNDYDYKCHICEKAFNHKPSLYAHIKTVHEQPTSHMCEICARTFKTREGFQSHKISHMETPPPRVSCHICGKKMKNRDTLNQHLLRHKHENDLHTCDICNREFNCKKRLNQHRKYVHAPAQLKCEHCDKMFKRPICLKEHMASHTGQLLYTCAYCPRQFNSNANKYSHQKAQHPVEWSLDKQKKDNEG